MFIGYHVAGHLLTSEVVIVIRERYDRQTAYQQARATADARGLPLLNVGCPGASSRAYPCGDTCLDVNPSQLRNCRAALPVVGDVRSLDYPDGYFGAVLCCHVLEHLPTPQDALAAYHEMARVSDGNVVVRSPSRRSLIAILHPEHRLWVDHQPDGSLVFVQR